jgi:hypothetical protein
MNYAIVVDFGARDLAIAYNVESLDIFTRLAAFIRDHRACDGFAVF